MASSKVADAPALRESIDKAVANSTPEVVDGVVQHFVKNEVQNRISMVVAAVSKLQTMDDDIKKFKPDQVSLDEDGNEVSSTFSKAKFEERKKLVEKRDKLASAIEKALGKDRDFAGLKKVSEGS